MREIIIGITTLPISPMSAIPVIARGGRGAGTRWRRDEKEEGLFEEAIRRLDRYDTSPHHHFGIERPFVSRELREKK
jgi:hypothetical protein